jgi:polyhydroxybutyrate depolymerase
VLSVNAIGRITAAVAVLLSFVGYSGPRASALPGGDVPGELVIGGLPRTYQVHVPAGLDQPAGLVVNLHGAGMTGGGQAAATNYNAIADQHGFVVAYPDGIDFSWADGRGASIPDRQGVDDVGFLAALIDRLSRDYGIAPGRVYATGMSAGAFMATRLACERADLVSAIAPVAGTLGIAFPCAPSRPVSVLQVHGTADQVVPFGGGTMLGRGGYSDIVAAPAIAQRWRDVDGCPGAPVEDTVGAVHRFTAGGCAGGTEVDFVQVDGAGHLWPTGPGFDASQESGQFFATHGR